MTLISWDSQTIENQLGVIMIRHLRLSPSSPPCALLKILQKEIKSTDSKNFRCGVIYSVPVLSVKVNVKPPSVENNSPSSSLYDEPDGVFFKFGT